MNTHDIELPPLPEDKIIGADNFIIGTLEVMELDDVQDYARAAIEADRKRRQLEAEGVCAEAYQVVGSLLSDLGIFETHHAKKILDNLSQAKMVHDDVLPWPSFDRKRKGEPVAYRLLRKNADGEWVTDGRPWCDGVPDADLVKDSEKSGQYRIEYAFAAPQPAVPAQVQHVDDINVADITAVSAEHATLNLQPSSSMQPVATAFFTEKGEVAFTGLFDRTLKALEAVKTTRMGISCGSIDLYTTPQPAETVKVPSDDEIIELRSEFDWREHYGNIRFARALLARYGQPAEPVKSHLRVSYDDKGDCLYVYCDSNEPAEAEENEQGILLWRAYSDGRLVGVTIPNFIGPMSNR